MAVLAVAFLAAAAPARADETASLANTLAAQQLIDVLQTRATIAGGGREYDPLAKPFAHSTPEMLVAASGLNVLARRLVGPQARPWILRAVVGLYPIVLLNNARNAKKRVAFSFKL